MLLFFRSFFFISLFCAIFVRLSPLIFITTKTTTTTTTTTSKTRSLANSGGAAVTDAATVAIASQCRRWPAAGATEAVTSAGAAVATAHYALNLYRIDALYQNTCATFP